MYIYEYIKIIMHKTNTVLKPPHERKGLTRKTVLATYFQTYSN
jgi:hypothetical protein